MAAQYAMLVKKSSGWEPLLDENNDVNLVASAEDLWDGVSGTFPKDKTLLVEDVEFNIEPFAVLGGSESEDVALQASVAIVTNYRGA